MKRIVFFFLASFWFGSVGFAASAPCDPATNNHCHKYTGIATIAGTHVKVPGGYFYSLKGVQRGWLIAQSGGTWRIRAMQWGHINPTEDRQHFHQIAHSDLTVAGSTQFIQFPVEAGFFQHQIECEDDCFDIHTGIGKSFDYFIEFP